MKTDATPEAAPAPTLHWKYNVGDIDLISSDNTLFKVHKYQLMAAGYVVLFALRDAHLD